MKKYLKHHLKKIMTVVIVFSVLGLFSVIIPTIISKRSMLPGFGEIENSNLLALAIFIFITTLIVAILEFYPLKTKKGADLYYSLPYSKKRLHLELYLKGLFQIFLIFTILYIPMFLIPLIKGYYFKYILYLPMYFTYLITITVVYTIIVFIFTRANTLIDGILFIVLFTLTPILFTNAFSVFFGNIFNNSTFINPFSRLDPLKVYPFYPIFYTNDLFIRSVERRHELIGGGINKFSFFNENLYYLGLWIVVSGVFAYFLFNDPKKKAAEEVGQISNSILGYKTLIPILIFSFSYIFLDVNQMQAGGYYWEVYLYLSLTIGLSILLTLLYERKFNYQSLHMILSVILPLSAFLIHFLMRLF